MDQMTIFKLSALARLQVQGNGSCGDIAASRFRGWIAFSTFEPDWVKNAQETMSLTELLATPWPSLIEPLTVPKNVRLFNRLDWQPGFPQVICGSSPRIPETGRTGLPAISLRTVKTAWRPFDQSFPRANVPLIKEMITKTEFIKRFEPSHRSDD